MIKPTLTVVNSAMNTAIVTRKEINNYLFQEIPTTYFEDIFSSAYMEVIHTSY